MTRFIHTADNHIMDAQYGKAFRGKDFRRAFDQVIDHAIAKGVDFIVNSGDILDKNRPSEHMLEYLFRVDRRLREAELPMYCITGNHDASDPSFLTLPQFSEEAEAGIICIDNKTLTVQGGLTLAGFPAVPWEKVHEDLERREEQPDIVVWHGAIQEWQPYGVDLSIEDVWKSKFRLGVLAGDLHIHRSIRDDKDRLFTYPGSTEMTKRDHERQKYCDLYTLEDLRLPDPEPLEIKTRTFLALRADSEERAADCVAKVKQAMKDDPERGPIVFLTHNWAFKDVVDRIKSVLDPSDSYFSYRVLNSTGGYVKYATTETAEEEAVIEEVHRPDLQNVVDLTIAPTDKLNPVARQLAMPGADSRAIIQQFLAKELTGIGLSYDAMKEEPEPQDE